ncbi:MAG TPA: tripartite tricarboxylate transporter substrate-binding protein [Candidatus Limnocylindria bacterium]|nr:tripartite tricarboxylate transporter substrate-binding protein [Candidatus Limnocylindria bacterium]
MRAFAILTAGLLVAAACGGSSTPAATTTPAASVAATATTDPNAAIAAFYQGKTVRIIIGYSAGGGYDTYARTLAAHIGNHIPGKPTVIVENMPGAGSMKALNYIYSAAPKDGTVFGTFGRGLPEAELRGEEGVGYKSRELNWLGSMNEEVSVCVVRSDTPIKTFEDAQKQTVTVGATGPDDDTGFFPRVLNALAGTKFELKTGYPGGSDVLLGVERGEVMGRCGWSWSSVVSTKKQWIDTNYVRILTQMSLNKHPDIPKEVPLATEFVKNADDKQLLEVIFARQAIGRPYAAPPGIPAERAKALQDAFEKTMKDPAFLADANKAKQEINPKNAAETKTIIEKILGTPPALVAKLKQIAG